MQDVVRQGFKRRIFEAHHALELREGGRVSREEVGKRVGKALGVSAYPQSTVASWFSEILPPADVGAGIASVYGVTAGWLYFGEGQMAEAGKPPRVEFPKVVDQTKPFVVGKGKKKPKQA